ncbi:MAG: hypothetical protein GX589_00290 [Deltaproteobacteria bacterium]|nr:hypothetical protein [Deltaproteobacteria bacterium]
MRTTSSVLSAYRFLLGLGLVFWWCGLSPAAVAQADPDSAPPTPHADAAEPQALSPYVDLPAIKDEKFALLQDAVFNQSALDFPQDMMSVQNQGHPWQEWKNDNYKIVGDVEHLLVRFEHMGEISEKSTKASSFYISIRFEEQRPLAERMNADPKNVDLHTWGKMEGITIKHSLPKRTSQAGGVMIPSMGLQQRRVFMEGRDQTGVVALVPESRVRGVRGVVLCVRDYDLWKLKGGARLLEDTGYKMAGVDAVVSGSAQAKVNTGFGPGVARASVQVTPNINPSRVVEDESRAVYPYASVEYLARKTERPVPSEQPQSVTAGIRLQTVLHNSLNHKTVSTGTVVMTIKRIPVKRDMVILHELNEKQIKFNIKAGECYAVLKESKLEHQFIKEDLPQMPGSVQKGDDLLNALTR